MQTIKSISKILDGQRSILDAELEEASSAAPTALLHRTTAVARGRQRQP